MKFVQFHTTVGMWIVSLALVAAAILAPSTASLAVPAPTSGPTAGGTVISGDVEAIGFTDIVTSTLTGGSAVTFGLGDDGKVYGWGDNSQGQLGNGAVGGRALVPTAVLLPEEAYPVSQIAAAFLGGYAIGADGNAYSWGANGLGQAGNGTSGGSVTVPVQVSLPSAALPALEIAGYVGGFVRGSDGRVYSWGANSSGQIGNGTSGPASVLTPVVVNLPSTALPAKRVTVDGNTTFVIGNDGLLYAWGDNSSRQVGNNSPGMTIASPTPVSLPAAALPVAQAVGTSLGGSALGADGNVYGWGGNASGQVGNGAFSTNVPTPVVTVLPSAALPAAKIGGSAQTGYAVGANGLVYSWGNNSNGQLGNGAPGNRHTPAIVNLPEDATPVSRVNGGTTGYVLNAQGDLFSWGLNTNGQIGNGTSGADVLTPLRVATSTVTAVTVGGAPVADLSQIPSHAAGGPVVSWTGTTPAGCGPADVVVTWTQAGEVHTQSYPGGFVYGSAPTFTTQPESGTISPGAPFLATVAVEGDSAPTVQWQQEGPADTWVDLPGETSATLNVAAVSSTMSYRAVATNCWATPVTSDVATATVVRTHSVSFDANGGSGVMADQIAEAPTPLAANAFTREGFVFAGWNAHADGTGEVFLDGGVFDFAADVTLFAQWDAVAPSLTIRVESPEIRQGSTQRVTAGGFVPGERVVAVERSIDLLQPETRVGTQTASAGGTVTFAWKIPIAATLGAHSITVSGDTSGTAAGSFSVIAAGAPLPPSGQDGDRTDLSRTGSPEQGLLLSGGLTVAVGGLALLVAARRRGGSVHTTGEITRD